MNLLLAPARDADNQWLDQLRRDAYRELFDATWGAWDEARHRRHFAASIEQGNIRIIRVDGHQVGMLQLLEHHSCLTPGDPGTGVIEIAEIQLRPEAQRQGIGTAVLSDVIRSARERRMDVRLSTGRMNEHALRLYLRLGFHITQTSESHVHMALTHAPASG